VPKESPSVVRSKWVFQEFLFVAKVGYLIIHPQEDFVKFGYRPDMKWPKTLIILLYIFFGYTMKTTKTIKIWQFF
jgi:hypothetical protein